MKTEIRPQNITLEPKDFDFIERCLMMSMGRFSSQIRRVAVRIKDENGPKGGVDLLCKIEIVLQTGEQIHLETKDVDLHSGVHYLSKRATRKIKRLIAKRKKFVHNNIQEDFSYGT